MKKFFKFLMAILVIIIMAIGGIIYALQPEGGIKEDTTGNREMTKDDIIQMGLLQSLNFKKETGKFEGTISLNSEQISNIVYTAMKESDPEDILPNDIKIIDNSIVITVPMDIEFIKTQAEVKVIPSVRNGDFIATIDNVKLGKINISGNLLSKIMNHEKDEIPYEIQDRSIIIPTETIKPIELTKIYIENNELKFDMQLALKDAMQYVYSGFIRPAA